MKIFILVLFFADFLWDLYNIKKCDKKMRYISKSLLMPLLLVYYLFASGNINIFIVVALISGFLGDVFLLNDDKQPNLTLGILSFMIGHVFYILTYIKIAGGINNIPMLCALMIVPYILYGIFMYKKLFSSVGNLIIPAFIYISLLVLNSFCCLAVLVLGYPSLIFSFIGTLLFIVSDSALSFDVFVSREKFSVQFVMITYVAAQFLIICGLI